MIMSQITPDALKLGDIEMRDTINALAISDAACVARERLYRANTVFAVEYKDAFSGSEFLSQSTTLKALSFSRALADYKQMISNAEFTGTQSVSGGTKELNNV